MTNSDALKIILPVINATKIKSIQVIQNLWSDYGYILRINTDSNIHPSIVVKDINLSNIPKHPRGWNTDISHQRKLKSYEVEEKFYKNDASKCKTSIVPGFIDCIKEKKRTLLILEDLDAIGFNQRKESLSIDEIKSCVRWLANFHTTFLNEPPNHLWQIGTYWHLETRQDELAALNNPELEEFARSVDQRLNEAEFQTFVHGDAKVANFCFSKKGLEVAAVDFQYIGGGCGIKDLTYFMGSVLDENECNKLEGEILDYYFTQIKSALSFLDKNINFSSLESEWRELYPLCWADFSRFLMGWRPGHWKLNNYTKKMMDKAGSLIKK